MVVSYMHTIDPLSSSSTYIQTVDPLAESREEIGVVSLYKRQKQENLENELKANEYQQRAMALRKEADELMAAAKRHIEQMTHGEDLLQSLGKRMEADQQGHGPSAKRKRSPEPSMTPKTPMISATGLCSRSEEGHQSLYFDRATAVRDRAQPHQDPREKFAHDTTNHPLAKEGHIRSTRIVSFENSKDHILIYTDGACLNQKDRRDNQSRTGGCAVVYGTRPRPGALTRHPSLFYFRLENESHDGQHYVATSNRAELRAATAALECRMWGTEGWKRVTIAADSNYVVDGITEYSAKWKANGWTKANGREAILNKDLWSRLLYLVNEQARAGCEVQFWRCDKGFNEADRWAKLAATQEEISRYCADDLVKRESSFRPQKVE